MTDPKVWWDQMPIVTKTLFGSSFGLTLAANFGLVSPMSLIFSPTLIWNKFQIWRLVTCGFFFGKLGFPFLMTMYWLYSYSLRLEQGQFERRLADYVWAITVVWIVLLAVAYVMNFMVIGQAFVSAIVYMWCSMNADVIVNFWFGMVFQAMYFPWVLLMFAVLTGGSGIPELTGIFAGHVYFFLKVKYPRDFGGPCYIETPQFMHRWFPGDADMRAPSSFGSTREGARPPPRTWGGGHRLGD